MTERTHSFTGKSDFFDWCNMHYTPETIIEKATIFLGDAEIKKDKPEDLIPYYTHIITSAGCTPEKQSIFLSVFKLKIVVFAVSRPAPRRRGNSDLGLK